MQRELESANPVTGKLVNQPYLHYMEWQRSRLQYYIGQVRAGVELIQSLSMAQAVQPMQPQHPVNMVTPPPFERQESEITTLEEGSVDDESTDGKKGYATKEIILEAVDLFMNKYESQIQHAIISHNFLQERWLVKQVCAEACKRIAIKTRRESLVSETVKQ
jgi:hypothetical protein